MIHIEPFLCDFFSYLTFTYNLAANIRNNFEICKLLGKKVSSVFVPLVKTIEHLLIEPFLLRHQDFLTLTDVEASALWGFFLLFAVDGVIGSILNRSQQHSTNGCRL